MSNEQFHSQDGVDVYLKELSSSGKLQEEHLVLLKEYQNLAASTDQKFLRAAAQEVVNELNIEKYKGSIILTKWGVSFKKNLKGSSYEKFSYNNLNAELVNINEEFLVRWKKMRKLNEKQLKETQTYNQKVRKLLEWNLKFLKLPKATTNMLGEEGGENSESFASPFSLSLDEKIGTKQEESTDSHLSNNELHKEKLQEIWQVVLGVLTESNKIRFEQKVNSISVLQNLIDQSRSSYPSEILKAHIDLSEIQGTIDELNEFTDGQMMDISRLNFIIESHGESIDQDVGFSQNTVDKWVQDFKEATEGNMEDIKADIQKMRNNVEGGSSPLLLMLPNKWLIDGEEVPLSLGLFQKFVNLPLIHNESQKMWCDPDYIDFPSLELQDDGRTIPTPFLPNRLTEINDGILTAYSPACVSGTKGLEPKEKQEIQKEKLGSGFEVGIWMWVAGMLKELESRYRKDVPHKPWLIDKKIGLNMMNSCGRPFAVLLDNQSFRLRVPSKWESAHIGLGCSRKFSKEK